MPKTKEIDSCFTYILFLFCYKLQYVFLHKSKEKNPMDQSFQFGFQRFKFSD
jgi:hypothetical protein